MVEVPEGAAVELLLGYFFEHHILHIRDSLIALCEIYLCRCQNVLLDWKLSWDRSSRVSSSWVVTTWSKLPWPWGVDAEDINEKDAVSSEEEEIDVIDAAIYSDFTSGQPRRR
jgi:hypothetical protein